METIETCPMCGEALEASSSTEVITDYDCDHFCLDTGTVVHKECFDMEAPPEPGNLDSEEFEDRWWLDW